MAYEDIAVPVGLTPASAGMFGVKVRDYIIDLDRRVRAVESTAANYKFKNSSTARSSTVTLTGDPDLFLPLEANSQYFIEIFLIASGLTAADFKTTWTVPSGTTGNRRVLGPATTTTASAIGDLQQMRIGVHPFGSAAAYNMPGDAVGANMVQIQEVGVINVGVTAGDIGLNWAQLVSNAGATTVHADSFMRATMALG